MNSRWRCMIAALFMLAAGAGSGSAQMGAGEKAALEIGEKYVASNFADYDKSRKKPVVRDRGEHWEFTYELPIDMLGGSPHVIIDKKTMQVVRAYRTQ